MTPCPGSRNCTADTATRDYTHIRHHILSFASWQTARDEHSSPGRFVPCSTRTDHPLGPRSATAADKACRQRPMRGPFRQWATAAPGPRSCSRTGGSFSRAGGCAPAAAAPASPPSKSPGPKLRPALKTGAATTDTFEQNHRGPKVRDGFTPKGQLGGTRQPAAQDQQAVALPGEVAAQRGVVLALRLRGPPEAAVLQCRSPG